MSVDLKIGDLIGYSYPDIVQPARVSEIHKGKVVAVDFGGESELIGIPEESLQYPLPGEFTQYLSKDFKPIKK